MANGCELTASTDLDEERARALFPQPTNDYRRLLERGAIDTIIVATPSDLHREISIAALEAGELRFNPADEAHVDAGEYLIAMGEQAKLEALELELGNGAAA